MSGVRDRGSGNRVIGRGSTTEDERGKGDESEQVRIGSGGSHVDARPIPVRNWARELAARAEAW